MNIPEQFLKCKKYKYLPRNVVTFHWLFIENTSLVKKYNILPNSIVLNRNFRL